ncbi:MAG: hypothetical protein PHF86_11155 [Candidatus Nanoarchaeia archaeon]|nr:hypothetical protein [Candidatus Nanoarchaeia archaeon]
MNEEEKYLEYINSALKLISETLDNHTSRINGLLEIVNEQNKIIEKLVKKIDILEVFTMSKDI